MTQGLVRLRILRAAIGGTGSGVEPGWRKSRGKTVKGKRRRYYRATKTGREDLGRALIALNQFVASGPSFLM